jgi:hypothetical protein
VRSLATAAAAAALSYVPAGLLLIRWKGMSQADEFGFRRSSSVVGGLRRKEVDVARTGRTILLGVAAGTAMALALFVTGAVAARLVYGPQMVPEGKFTADQVSAGYFFWTKLLIGVFFGILLSVLYERLPLARRIRTAREGLLYAFLLWVVVYLWGFSHPFVYELRWSIDRNQVFWMVYTLGGFLGLGLAFGGLRTRLLGQAA